MLAPPILAIFVILALASVFGHQVPLLLISLGVLLADGLARVWRKYCLVGIEYHRTLSHEKIEWGRTAELQVEVVNRKLLPVPWLRTEDEIPDDFRPKRGRVMPSHKPERPYLTGMITLRPYERVVRRYSFPCNTRGEHVLGPTRLETGDLFGLFTETIEIDQTDTIVVYPRVVRVEELGLPASQPLGDIRTRSWVFEDPSRFAGVREYRPEDSLRRVHWAASARTQELQVKVFEPTTTQKLALFLNADSTDPEWGLAYDPDTAEMAITVAASISAWALEQGYEVGLMTNGINRGRTLRVSVEPASDPGQLERILVALGRLGPYTAQRFGQTLAQGAGRLTYGETVVVVSGGVTAADVATLISMRRRGHPVTLLLTGDWSRSDAQLEGIVVRRVGPASAWRDMPALAPEMVVGA